MTHGACFYSRQSPRTVRVRKCASSTGWDRQQLLDLHQTHLWWSKRPFCSREDISLEQQREVRLHVETVMLAGTLMLLLITANTLMLYSTPASRPEMVEAVVLPGILISNGTPDRKTGRRRQLVYCILIHLFGEVDWTLSAYLQRCLACRSPGNPWAPLSPPTPGRRCGRLRLGSSDSWPAPLQWEHILDTWVASDHHSMHY